MLSVVEASLQNLCLATQLAAPWNFSFKAIDIFPRLATWGHWVQGLQEGEHCGRIYRPRASSQRGKLDPGPGFLGCARPEAPLRSLVGQQAHGVEGRCDCQVRKTAASRQ
jgi:hypothetical protein